MIFDIRKLFICTTPSLSKNSIIHTYLTYIMKQSHVIHAVSFLIIISKQFIFASALCRAKADWIIGINATRLFSCLYNHTLNVGRVQTPTLKMLTDRDAAISHFQKEKYYHVRLDLSGAEAARGWISDKAEAAALFVRWLTESERNLDFVAQTGYMPVRNGAFDAIENYDKLQAPTESYRQLYAALKIMHESYTPLSEPRF